MQKGKMVEAITSMDVDFAKWYTDIVLKAELASYSGVKGCMIIRPYGTALWENMRDNLDKRFKALGHENVMMPMFIPESLLQKEKDHVEGFAPEVAWVTHGGKEKLTERLCIRPTSEVLFCAHYAEIIQSHRDLPKLYNQWCSVVRWEKTTRPFLRTTEFFWQEGHTMHETSDEAMDETLQMLDVYTDFCKEALAIPVLRGRKTDKEKFAGAEATFTIEPMMHDGRALQAGTSHFFGDGFSRAFDIQYSDRDNMLQYPFQTSWGASSRLIGAIIMSHGDDNGLIMPPVVAPIQLAIIPIAQHKAGVLEKAGELKEKLKATFRVSLDDSDNSPGWKFAECEMKGVPLRLEIGPRDIENSQCVLVRRDNGEKTVVSLDSVTKEIAIQLKSVHDSLYDRAEKRLIENTFSALTLDELIRISSEKACYVKTMWCEDASCEEEIKEKAGLSSRCIPFEQEELSKTCVCCGKPAKTMIVWGKAY